MELLAENSNISPRISFSHDLGLYDVVPVEKRHIRSDSSGLSSGFEFRVGSQEIFDHESTSADELFSEGKLLPSQIKKKRDLSKKQEEQQSDGEQEMEHEEQTMNQNSPTEEKQSSNTKSFWRFKRSSSLNCGSGYGRKLCPLPLLSRSNSTGSAPNSPKQAPLSKESHHHYQKQRHSTLKPLQPPANGAYQRPPLRKNSGLSHGNNIRVNPALNVHSGNLFGLGSIIFNGKEKNKRK